MTQPANIFGTDLAQITQADGSIDLDPGMSETSGIVLLLQRVIRRVTAARGSVVDAPNDCLDLRAFLRAGVLAATPASLQSQIQKEVLKESGVLTAAIGVTYSTATQRLSVAFKLTTVLGPLAFTMNLSNDTIAIIIDSLPVGF